MTIVAHYWPAACIVAGDGEPPHTTTVWPWIVERFGSEPSEDGWNGALTSTSPHVGKSPLEARETCEREALRMFGAELRWDGTTGIGRVLTASERGSRVAEPGVIVMREPTPEERRGLRYLAGCIAGVLVKDDGARLELLPQRTTRSDELDDDVEHARAALAWIREAFAEPGDEKAKRARKRPDGAT